MPARFHAASRDDRISAGVDDSGRQTERLVVAGGPPFVAAREEEQVAPSSGVRAWARDRLAPLRCRAGADDPQRASRSSESRRRSLSGRRRRRAPRSKAPPRTTRRMTRRGRAREFESAVGALIQRSACRILTVLAPAVDMVSSMRRRRRPSRRRVASWTDRMLDRRRVEIERSASDNNARRERERGDPPRREEPRCSAPEGSFARFADDRLDPEQEESSRRASARTPLLDTVSPYSLSYSTLIWCEPLRRILSIPGLPRSERTISRLSPSPPSRAAPPPRPTDSVSSCACPRFFFFFSVLRMALRWNLPVGTTSRQATTARDHPPICTSPDRGARRRTPCGDVQGNRPEHLASVTQQMTAVRPSI